MSFEIHKFGGSCLSSAEDIDAIVARIRDSKGRILVVVSAFQGITDRLIEQIDYGTEQSVPAFVSSVEVHHLERIPEIIDSPWSIRFADTLHHLSSQLEAYHRNPSVEVRADALACGERLSSLALSAALDAAGIPAVPGWSEDIGICLIGSGESGRIDALKTRDLLKLPLGAIPVITGWYGESSHGIALLGRGGSDLTATAIGAALDATQVTIWRDVQGVLALSPQWSLPGRNLSNLSYSEAAELALFSEPMLHPSAVEPLRKPGIPLRLRPLHSPEVDGTIIGPSLQTNDPSVRAVGCIPRLVPLSWTLSSALSLAESVSDATAALRRARIRVASIRAQPGQVRILVNRRASARAEKILGDLPSIPTPTVGEAISILCFVGEEIGNHSGINGYIRNAAIDGGFDLSFNAYEHRSHAIHASIPADQTELALHELCQALDLLVN
jgi:aspartate kinase